MPWRLSDDGWWVWWKMFHGRQVIALQPTHPSPAHEVSLPWEHYLYLSVLLSILCVERWPPSSLHRKPIVKKAQQMTSDIELGRLCLLTGVSCPKGPYLPCVSMAGRAPLAGYPRDVFTALSIVARCQYIRYFRSFWALSNLLCV